MDAVSLILHVPPPPPLAQVTRLVSAALRGELCPVGSRVGGASRSRFVCVSTAAAAETDRRSGEHWSE